MDSVVSAKRLRSSGSRIREQLLLQIRQQSANDQLPPETQLARQFGVHRLTVNKVMADLSREGYIERIRGKGTFIAAPDRRIRTDQSTRRKQGQLVIAYPDYFSYSLWSKVHAAEDLAHRNDVELVNLKMNKGTAYESVAALIKETGRDVRGAIILPPASIIDAKSASLLESMGIPVAVLAACDRPALGNNVVAIHRDYYKEGFLAAQYLIRAGHRRLGYIANEPWDMGSRLQYQGVKAGLYEHGLNLRDLARSPAGIPLWDSSIDAGYRFTTDLLKSGSASAFIYRSSPGAVGGMRAMAEAGLRVPDDISLVSEGEGNPREDYVTPPLTCIVCDYRAWMEVAFEVILDRSRRHEKRVIIDVQLVERGSVRAFAESVQEEQV